MLFSIKEVEDINMDNIVDNWVVQGFDYRPLVLFCVSRVADMSCLTLAQCLKSEM